MQFNLYRMLPLLYWNGFDVVLGKNLACDFIDVIDPTCDLALSFVEFYFDFPLCCADVGSWLGFDTGGFCAFRAWVRDVDLGVPGLAVDWLGVLFETEDKDVSLELGVSLEGIACIRPYASLVLDSSAEVAGFELDGLSVVCRWGDVTLTVSELFTNDDYFIGIDGVIHAVWDPIPLWILSTESNDEAYDVEETISVEVVGDGCCGGDSFLGLYSYFDADIKDSLFGWLGLRARFEYAVSRLVTCHVETWFWYDGWETIAFGFDMSWGVLDIITSELTCCQ